MTIVDVNVLLYASQADAPQHKAALAWLNELFAGPDLIGLPWIVLWAFVRLSTNSRLWPKPMPAVTAFEHIREWLSQPGVVIVQPGPRHAEILERLVIENRVVGGLVSDAVLAALALENGAVLASTDRDFSRFTNLRWVNPIP